MSALALLLLAAGSANPFLAEALEREQDLDFERCVERLQQAATQWKSTTAELRDIELHAGLCKLNLGRRKEAIEHFRTALRIDEATELPPYTSPKAVELFYEVKQKLRAPPPPLPDRDQPDPDLVDDTPRKPKLEPRAPQRSLLGGVLERRAVPLTFTAVTLVGAVVAISLGISAAATAAQANEARFESDFMRLGAQARSASVATNVTWVLTGLSASGAAVSWWLTTPPPASAAP